TLRIGLMRHRSEELLPQVLGDFLSSYPDVQLEVHEEDVAQLEQLLLRGDLDMALLTCDRPHPRLEYRQIASEEVVLIAGRQTELARRIPSGSTIGLREAAQERFILPTSDYFRRRFFDDLLAACSLRPNVCMCCDNVGAAMRACVSVNLVTLCPFISLLCDSGMMPKLAHYHLGTDAYLPPFYMAYAREQPLAPYAESLYTLLSNRFRAMSAYRI
ncbi:MAG: LysR family transcriptional regulator substrate-binding protein, partial [Candidatus Ventricola sp.]